MIDLLEEGSYMKRFEIYAAKLPYGSELGDNVIILQNEIADNMDSIICAPVKFGEMDNDKNNTHIKANTKNGRKCIIMTEHMRNLERKRINGVVDELTEEDCQYVKDTFSELMII